MRACSSGLKEKMLELTRLFCIENNIFQRFVIIYKYITLIDKDPITKNILQKIFDDTTKAMGQIGENLDENKFLNVKSEIIHTNEFWIYYANLKIIYNKMKKIKECDIDQKKEYDDLSLLFSKPYSKESLQLSFKVINSNIIEQLDKEEFLNSKKKKYNKLSFDNKTSILYIKGQKILISKQDRISNAHKILNHIFITNKKNIADDFFYSEIAEDEFHELDYKNRSQNWRKYFRACKDINDKVTTQTNNLITNFLKYNTGKYGKVLINKKYLNKKYENKG